MDEKQLSKLIEKYLAQQCSEEEKTLVEQWYEALEPGQAPFFNDDAQKLKDSTERSLKAIQGKLAEVRTDNISDHSSFEWSVSSRNRRIGRIAIWAAAACILVCIAVFLRFYINRSTGSEKYMVLSTGTGEVKQWKLADGSSVWLNAGSSMKVPTSFNEQKREVYLEGEAFFDVAREADKPFIIHSGKLDTRVLGTAFSISAYPGAALNIITVTQGEVQVSDATHVLGNLVADKKIEYRNGSGKNVITQVDAAKEIGWKAQQLAFTDLPMSDIAIHLQRWYGYRFYFKDQRLKDIRFTASFRNTISLPDLLQLLQEVSHVHYQLDHNTKTVTFL